VNPSRDSVPNPAEGASRPRTTRQLIPANSAARPLTPGSAAPRKPVCGFCGGPLKGGKGPCLKCGLEPLGRPDKPQPKKLKNEYGEEVEGLPHHFLSRDHEAPCQNTGCDIARRESLYDPSSQYCCGEQGRGAAV
jgi:hypothetical protein